MLMGPITSKSLFGRRELQGRNMLSRLQFWQSMCIGLHISRYLHLIASVVTVSLWWRVAIGHRCARRRPSDVEGVYIFGGGRKYVWSVWMITYRIDEWAETIIEILSLFLHKEEPMATESSQRWSQNRWVIDWQKRRLSILGGWVS